jgi:predicted DNA-binding protein
MPSKRKQLNIRLSVETEARLAGLVERMSETTGLDVSQAGVIQAALIELEKRYPPRREAKRGGKRGGKAED